MIIMGHGRMQRSININITSDHKATPDASHIDYSADAKRLARVLQRHLPSGTFDRLLKELFAIHMRDYLDHQAIRNGEF